MIGTPAACRPGEVERRLPAELHDHAVGLQRSQMLSTSSCVSGSKNSRSRGVVVGGHRLGVGVDHHDSMPSSRSAKAGMAAAVVELDALADAVGPAAEDHDRFLDLGSKRTSSSCS
jgi:hypothetical protein